MALHERRYRLWETRNGEYEHFVRFIQKTVASLFFLGYFPWMPGTIGSARGCGRRSGFLRYSYPCRVFAAFVVGRHGSLTAVSIAASSKVDGNFQADDPQQVIILNAMRRANSSRFSWRRFRSTFWSRLFAVQVLRYSQAYPIIKWKSIEGGIGITMDDVVAGVFRERLAHGDIGGISFCQKLL